MTQAALKEVIRFVIQFRIVYKSVRRTGGAQAPAGRRDR